MTISREMASEFARVALGHVCREYPSKLDHVIHGPQELQPPRVLHPIFFGSFDWHSCVHGYWLLTHLYRRFPGLPEAAAIRQTVDLHFTAVNVAVEVAYLRQPSRGTFERPYGWAWLLKLASELSSHSTDEGRRWYEVLKPLALEFSERFLLHLPHATYPIRAGAHYNSAFALALALEYAQVCEDAELAHCVQEKASAWYADDRDCQAWEPCGDDFLSPALMEVECMRRALTRAAFMAWLDGFLPRLAAGEPATLFEPARVSDRSDGKIAHLDGLNLSRAWCLRSLARALPERDARRSLVLEAAEKHFSASGPHVSGDYVGAHWLATFALLALADE
jgi:hypothetical protein